MNKIDYKKELINLLCIIYRDCGHYISEHGIKKSIKDAITIHYKLRDKNEG